MAALHFAIALRASPESARAVLDAIGEHSDLALGLVRGDALRLLGNESEAGQAYASVALRLGTNKPAAAAVEPVPEPAPEPAPKPATAPVAKAKAQKRAHGPAARVDAPEPPAGPAPEPVAKVEAPEPPPAIRWE